MAQDLVTGDTLPILRVTVKDENGDAFDMTGMTVKFRWLDSLGTVVEVAATPLVDVASYQFLAGEIFAPQMRIEMEITNAEGKTLTGGSLIILNVREAVG